jgi:glutathione S-transferase
VIDLHYWTTPNGHKITIFLEEAGLPYRIFPVNIDKGEQFKREFRAVSPDHRMPAIVDHRPAVRGGPLPVFESGAILLYLADKTKKFIPQDLRGRTDTIQWLFCEMGNLGPMSRQNSHFSNPAVEKLPYAMDRYRNEVNRLYGVLNTRLADRPYIAGELFDRRHGELSVRDAARAPAPEDRRLRAREALARRHQGASGGRARLCQGQGGEPERGRYTHPGGARDRASAISIGHWLNTATCTTSIMSAAGPRLPRRLSNRHGGYQGESCRVLQSEHEQHGLVAHFAKFRRIHEGGLGDPAKPRQDCNILLAANLKGHGRSVETHADIDLPKLPTGRSPFAACFDQKSGLSAVGRCASFSEK